MTITLRLPPGEHTTREPIRDVGSSWVPRGAMLGRYVVLDLLGEGGMGVVYVAYDPELDRKVAIKVMRAQRPDRRQSLMAEAQALAGVCHPNVVAIHDVGSFHGGGVFIAMELVAGPTLRAWMGEQRPWREVVAVMRAAGAGLSAVHAAGFVHRDFKPENVLLGCDGRVRVTDLGLARRRVDHELFAPIAGTIGYIPPELLRARADARGDVFAFGVTMYEALCGTRPYTHEELDTGEHAVPLPLPMRIPAQLRRIVRRAIELDPDQRYPTIDALLAELAELDTHRPRRILAAAALVLASALAAAASTHALRFSYVTAGATVALP